MAKRTIDPHLTPHPVLPGRAVSGRILPSAAAMTGGMPPGAAMNGPMPPASDSMGCGAASRLLPTLPPVMIAAVRPRGAWAASKPATSTPKLGAGKPKPVTSKAKPTQAKSKTAYRPRGVK